MSELQTNTSRYLKLRKFFKFVTPVLSASVLVLTVLHFIDVLNFSSYLSLWCMQSLIATYMLALGCLLFSELKQVNDSLEMSTREQWTLIIILALMLGSLFTQGILNLTVYLMYQNLQKDSILCAQSSLTNCGICLVLILIDLMPLAFLLYMHHQSFKKSSESTSGGKRQDLDITYYDDLTEVTDSVNGDNESILAPL